MLLLGSSHSEAKLLGGELEQSKKLLGGAAASRRGAWGMVGPADKVHIVFVVLSFPMCCAVHMFVFQLIPDAEVLL